MLTQEQIDRMDSITGLDNNSVQTNRLQELQARLQVKSDSVPQPETFGEKLANFTGGKIIGQGLGQMLANSQIAKQIEKTQGMQAETQGNLIKKIRENKALGKDTSRLEKALADLTIEIQQTGSGAEKLLNQKGITTKQVLGDALQLGTTVASVGSFGKGFVAGGKEATLKNVLTNTGRQKATPSVVRGVTEAATFGKGLIQGAKTGAISGTIFGASGGASGALKDDKSLADVAKNTVGGALVGLGTGAIVGGAIGGVSGAIKGREASNLIKKEDFVNDLVAPKATKAVKEQALREGRVTEQGLLSASKITPSKRDLQLADTVKDIVSSKNSNLQNLNVISDKVSEINTGVKAYVSVNKVPFNTSQLKTQLNNGRDELKLVFASDSNAKKTYDALVSEFMKHVKNKDTSGLLDARQTFDSLPAVKKLLDSQGLGENVKKEVALTIRSMANKYIANLLPAGNKFRNTLLTEHKMIEVIGNLAEKNASTIGKNKLHEIAIKYPVLKTLAGGLGAGLGLGAIGVGGSIISSTD